METKVIPLAQTGKWNDTVEKALNYDFYHLNSYHRLDTTGAPFLFVVSIGLNFIAIPLVKRKIEGTTYFDCTSVYGYAGPITNLVNLEEQNDLIRLFKYELEEYCISENIIAVFSRLHPLVEQNVVLDGIGIIEQLNKTIAIDLSLTLDEQRRQYRKSNKSEISQLHRKGFKVKIATSEEEVIAFTNIYTETMSRVEAHESYYFDVNYFQNFLAAHDFSSQLLLAYKEDVVTAGAIFTTTKNFMQYHLAGTKSEYIRETPMKLIIDEARHLGTNLKLKYLHLGGGVGGVDSDPLYRFKSGFSDLNFQFQVWKYIPNETIYSELVEAKSAKQQVNSNYFPLYRG